MNVACTFFWSAANDIQTVSSLQGIWAVYKRFREKTRCKVLGDSICLGSDVQGLSELRYGR